MRHPDSGTKVILEDSLGRILCCLRDDNPDIPYPGKWDLPGGGVDPGESMLDCAYRELHEEFRLTGVRLTMLEVVESRFTPGKLLGRAHGRLTAHQVASIVFGPEGQRFDFLTRDQIAAYDFVPELQEYILALDAMANRVITLERTA